jgi:hypothetical protein
MNDELLQGLGIVLQVGYLLVVLPKILKTLLKSEVLPLLFNKVHINKLFLG